MPRLRTQVSPAPNGNVTPRAYSSSRNASGSERLAVTGGRRRHTKGGAWEDGRRSRPEQHHDTTMKPIKENPMSKWRTRALCGLAGAFVIAAGASTASATATCGDLNTSGGRDAGDAVRLSLAINVGASTADCGASGSLQCGDLVKNGTLQVDDLVFMQQLLAGRTN